MANIKTQFLPAPISGLNIISDPTNLQPTEARQLDNYYIYDWGIREKPATVQLAALPDGGYPIQMFSFTSEALAKQYTLISTSNTNIYLYDGSGYTVWHAGTNFAGATAFNKKIILPLGGTTSVDTLTVASGARVAAAFTTAGNCIGSFVFKDRLYFWSDGLAGIEYGAVGAVAGALTNFDLGQVFKKGQKIVFGCSWSYNQGQTNDDLFVIGNEAGEILIYSGSYPAHANWGLLTRLEIPAPLNVPGFNGLVNVLKLGQDIIINTSRGALSLAAMMAGKTDQTGYYAVSKNIGPVLSGAQTDLSLQVPFAYFGANSDVYVLNYERGAWSKFPDVVTGGDYVTCISCQAPSISPTYAPSLTSYVLIGTHSGKILKISETALVSTAGTTHIWVTPYFNFSYPRRKQVGDINVLSRDMASSLVTNSVGAYADFDESSAGTMHTPTTTVTSTTYTRQLVQPATNPAVWSSFKFSKTGSATALNEIAGFDISYEELGAVR